MNIRQKLIDAGIRNLKEFGYPSVTRENILTDRIYSAFFKSMLKDHRGLGEKEAQALLKEIVTTNK